MHFILSVEIYARCVLLIALHADDRPARIHGNRVSGRSLGAQKPYKRRRKLQISHLGWSGRTPTVLLRSKNSVQETAGCELRGRELNVSDKTPPGDESLTGLSRSKNRVQETAGCEFRDRDLKKRTSPRQSDGSATKQEQSTGNRRL